MNKQFILIACLISLIALCINANAATVTWTGSGADNLASNPANWSGNTAPQYGDNVIFDSTSKDCTWDLDVTLASLSIKSGYSGKITKISGVSLTIAKNFVSPEAPTGLNATTVSSSQIDLSWTDNSDKESGFKIERKIGIDGTYSQIATVGANIVTYSDTGLTQGTTYYYQIRAYNSFGDSAFSDEANAATTSPPPPLNWYDSNWQYRQEIIINSSMTPADQTNFPLLVKITDQTNPIFNNAQSDGGDILFTLSDGITKLDHEIEYYQNTAASRAKSK